MRIRTLCSSFFMLAMTVGSVSAKDDYGAMFANLDLSEIEEVSQAETGNTPMVLPQRVDSVAKLTVTNPGVRQAASSPKIKTNEFVKDNAQVNYTEACETGCATDSCSGGCPSGNCGCSKGCCLGATCVPHTPPNLPISTFHQYFKSNACNTRVWDGYRNQCLWSSKHSRGECDCFTKKKSCLSGCGETVAPTCDTQVHSIPESWVASPPSTGCDLSMPAGCDDGGSMSCDTMIGN